MTGTAARALVLLLGVLLACGAAADPISLPNRTIDEPPGVELELSRKLGAAMVGQSVPAVVQLERLPLRTERGELAAKGIHLGLYLGSHAWFARIEARTQLAGIASPFRWAGVILPQDKVSRALWTVVSPGPAVAGTVQAVVHFRDGTPPEKQKSILNQHAQSAARFGGSQSWAIEIDPASVSRLADEDPVRWIETRPAGPSPL